MFGFGHDYERGLTDLSTLDRSAGAAAPVGVRRLVLRVHRPHRRRLREHDPAGLPLQRCAAGRPGHRHGLQGARHVERLGVRPGQVPRSRRVLRLVEPPGPAQHAEHPPEHHGQRTRSSRRRRPRRRTRCGRAVVRRVRRPAVPATSSTGATPTSSRRTWTCTAEMDQEGNDFWWLDWCCDATDSSLQGVTPDAWINQQYANDSDRRSAAVSSSPARTARCSPVVTAARGSADRAVGGQAQHDPLHR